MAAVTGSGDSKISLPSFLRIFTSNDVPISRAMALAGKIYKECNTSAALVQLTDLRLKSLGIDSKDDRSVVLSSLKKAGYTADLRNKLTKTDAIERANAAGPSTMTAVQAVTTPAKKRKRRRDDDLNEMLPDGPTDDAEKYGSMDFNEVLDESILKLKSTVVNRAPLMMAWAMVVAERMGFRREEALSIAAVYAEMNAITKGISLGIFDKSKGKNLEATKGGAQPYVDLMGRRPLYQTQASQWRALSSNAPALPSAAFSYISRAFRQTTPHMMGALRLLAATFGAQELNERGYPLYAGFRPDVEGWGGKGEVRCETILSLRKVKPPEQEGNGGSEVGNVIKYEVEQDTDGLTNDQGRGQGSPAKKSRILIPEKNEDSLDRGTTLVFKYSLSPQMSNVNLPP